MKRSKTKQELKKLKELETKMEEMKSKGLVNETIDG